MRNPEFSRVAAQGNVCRGLGNDPRARDLGVERVGSLNGLHMAMKVWEELLENEPHRSIFLSPQMFLSWWRVAEPKSELFILLVRRRGEPIGCAPMILKRSTKLGIPVRSIQFCLPRGDIIAPADRELVVRRLVRYWEQTEKEWDVISLCHVPDRSGTLLEVQEGVRRSRRLRFRAAGAGPAEAFLPADSSWDTYVRSKSKHFRDRLRQQCRRIECLGRVRFRTYRHPEDADRAFAEFLALEDRSWKPVSGTRLPPPERSCFLDLARDTSGRIQYDLCFLDLDEVPVAAMFSILYAGQWYAFVTYYDERVRQAYPGRPLLRHVLQEAFARPDVREVSFVGSYPFSRSWTSFTRGYGALRIYNGRFRSRLVSLVDWLQSTRAIGPEPHVKGDESDP